MKTFEVRRPGAAVFDAVMSVIAMLLGIANFVLDDWNAAIFFLLVALWFK